MAAYYALCAMYCTINKPPNTASLFDTSSHNVTDSQVPIGLLIRDYDTDTAPSSPRITATFASSEGGGTGELDCIEQQ